MYEKYLLLTYALFNFIRMPEPVETVHFCQTCVLRHVHFYNLFTPEVIGISAAILIKSFICTIITVHVDFSQCFYF